MKILTLLEKLSFSDRSVKLRLYCIDNKLHYWQQTVSFLFKMSIFKISRLYCDSLYPDFTVLLFTKSSLYCTNVCPISSSSFQHFSSSLEERPKLVKKIGLRKWSEEKWVKGKRRKNPFYFFFFIACFYIISHNLN